MCIRDSSRPRTQILSIFILAAILNKFPLSVDKSVTWFLLCARVFSPAAAILKSEKTLGTRLVVDRNTYWWHSPEKAHTGKEEESFHCFHKTKKHNVGFGYSLTNHWKLHHYFCCSSELSNDSTQKEEHEVSMSAHQSSRRFGVP